MSSENIQNNKLQLLGKMTAGLLHEIRNPLSAIKLGLAHLIMIEDELPSEANETVKSSTQALERIQDLVDNVLDFSRKTAGKEQECSINEITKYSITLLHGLAFRNKILIQSSLEDNLPNLIVDKNKLLQVFINLISNAIEAFDISSTKQKKCITISTFRNKEDIVWQIKDNGIGICDSDKDKIFNDFFTKKHKGTGLGLSVCNSIIRDYNSQLLFDSELGEGTTFSVIFNSCLVKG
ncbi:MAG: HAMP domain-containing sensor histidine kinase [Bacteroidota bacterium]|nr:HAMP domain-containing sensor histidine kinase [Bacteroidota bacterium]